MSRRGAVAVGILVAWVAGIGFFVRGELFRGPEQRLAEAALRISPGAMFYRVDQTGRQIGFASSTIDTTRGIIQVVDYLVADLPIAGRNHRVTAQSSVHLTRALALQSFALSFESDRSPIVVAGRTVGDSVLAFTVQTDPAVTPDTQRVRLTGPILLPTVVPLAVALGERPAVGKSYTLTSFDPTAMAPRPVQVRVAAESLFVVGDSAAFDASTRRWKVVHSDSVRAWRLESDSRAGFTGWVDEQGRIVRVAQVLGFDLTRTAYEVAFENWRATRTGAVGRDRDILETTAIAASVPLGRAALPRLRVRLSGAPLTGYDLAGNGQTLTGDTLAVTRATTEQMTPAYEFPARQADSPMRRQLRAFLTPEPLVQSNAPEIAALAQRLRGTLKNPRDVAERISRWVYDSLRKTVTVSVPSAVQVLRARSGDCNEHTQLFVALARAAGIPARPVAGLAYADGKFYYHAWPEIYLGTWVPVDPTFGQFPADAAHLRFVEGGLARQADLLRLVGQLEIQVLTP
jgi:transglutaminase superfamily protein